MSISLPDTKTKAPHQLIQSKNYNECDFLMSMISEHCKLGTGFAIARNDLPLHIDPCHAVVALRRRYCFVKLFSHWIAETIRAGTSPPN